MGAAATERHAERASPAFLSIRPEPGARIRALAALMPEALEVDRAAA